MKHIKDNIIGKLKLFEYFLIDPDSFPSSEEIKEIRKENIDKSNAEKHLIVTEDLSKFIWEHVTNQGEKAFGAR